MMNETANMNNEMGRSFLRFGIIIILVTAVIFIGKSYFGYESVTLKGTFDNCTVKTWSHSYRAGRGGTRTRYYVSVSHLKSDGDISIDFDKLYNPNEDYDIYNDSLEEESERLFYCEVPYAYYKEFENYRGKKVTFYTDSDGIYFPVFTVDSNKKEAERAYRKLVPPFPWYLLYAIGVGIGLTSIYLSFQSKKAAYNYDNFNTYTPTNQINTTEDALSYMATQRIRREKEQERSRRRNSFDRFNRY